MTSDQYAALIGKFINRQITAEEFTRNFTIYFQGGAIDPDALPILAWLNEKITIEDEAGLRLSAAKALRDMDHSAP